MRPLVTLVIQSLENEVALDSSLELLTDILGNYSGLYTDSQYDMLATILTSQPAVQRYQSLLQVDADFDCFQFGQLLLAFGDARVDELMRADDERSLNILSTLCQLLLAQGHPGVDDKMFVPTLEFWATFAETLTDESGAEPEDAETWQASARAFVLQAVSNAWQRVSYPSLDETSQWDSSERIMFHDARKDVADLLRSTFALSGTNLVFKFAELVLKALSSSDWSQLEAAAYCLSALADCINDDDRCDQALSLVFSTPLLEPLQSRQSDVSPRVRQTCVFLIENYTDYFERNVSQLHPVLNLLFTLVSEPAMATPASRSISRLCSSCRGHLFHDVGGFLNEYQGLSSQKQVDCTTAERIIGGIACVAQALPTLDSKLEACGRLVDFVENDVRLALKLANSITSHDQTCPPGSRCLEEAGSESPALHIGLKALRCLGSIGHGFRSPADAPIDLDANKSIAQSTPELTRLQQRIFGVILQIQSLFPADTDVTDCICTILRCGFSETEPGPFVFHPHDMTQYLAQHSASTPRIGALVNTACSFVSSLHTQHIEQKEERLSTVLLWVVGLIQQLECKTCRLIDFTITLTWRADLNTAPEMDPELSQTAIEFVTHLINKSPVTLLHLQPPSTAEFFFLFTLRVLDGKEPLPKAAAAEFWVRLPRHLPAPRSRILTDMA